MQITTCLRHSSCSCDATYTAHLCVLCVMCQYGCQVSVFCYNLLAPVSHTCTTNGQTFDLQPGIYVYKMQGRHEHPPLMPAGGAEAAALGPDGKPLGLGCPVPSDIPQADQDDFWEQAKSLYDGKFGHLKTYFHLKVSRLVGSSLSTSPSYSAQPSLPRCPIADVWCPPCPLFCVASTEKGEVPAAHLRIRPDPGKDLWASTRRSLEVRSHWTHSHPPTHTYIYIRYKYTSHHTANRLAAFFGWQNPYP